MTNQQQGQQGLSAPEREFSRRWRELIDKAGGQTRVVNRLRWSSSTVSRDYAGETLPTDDRARQLCGFLGLGQADAGEVFGLLEQARAARRARKQDDPGQPGESAQPPSPTAGGEGRERPDGAGTARARGRRRTAAIGGAAALGVAAVILVVAVWHPWSAGTTASGSPTVVGNFAGIGVKAVEIPAGSLSPALDSAFRHGQAASSGQVAGYVFRNIRDPRLCLSAVGTGPAAGHNGDLVEIETCDGAASQVWIPEQWETSRSQFSHLVSYRYQSMCLNARDAGGLRNGQKTMLWNCYSSPNESWDFGDWYQHAQNERQAYPIFVDSARLCLDADKFDYRDGDGVNIWNQYAAAWQFWS
jgi:hypothetical protein